METPWFDPTILVYVGAGAIILVLVGLTAFLISVWRDSRRRYEIAHQARLLHPPEGQQPPATKPEGPPDEEKRWLEGPGRT